MHLEILSVWVLLIFSSVSGTEKTLKKYGTNTRRFKYTTKLTTTVGINLPSYEFFLQLYLIYKFTHLLRFNFECLGFPFFYRLSHFLKLIWSFLIVPFSYILNTFIHFKTAYFIAPIGQWNLLDFGTLLPFSMCCLLLPEAYSFVCFIILDCD